MPNPSPTRPWLLLAPLGLLLSLAACSSSSSDSSGDPAGTESAVLGAHGGARALLRIDTATAAAERTTTAGTVGWNQIAGLTYDTSSDTLIGIDARAIELVRVDPMTGDQSPIAPIRFDGPVPSSTSFGSLALDAATGTLYSATGFPSRSLVSIDAATGRATEIGPLGSDSIDSLAFDPASGALFGATINRSLFRIDTATGAATLEGEMAVGAGGMVFDASGALWVVRSESCSLGALLGARLQAISPITLEADGSPVCIPYEDVASLAYDPLRDVFFGYDEGSGMLLRIANVPGLGLLTEPVGGGAFGFIGSLAPDPLSGQLFALDGSSRRVLVIDPATGRGRTVASLGPEPLSGLALDPMQRLLYSARFGSGDLVSIDPVSGDVAVVGASGFSEISGLAFGPGAELFGVERSSRSLVRLDTATGQGTLVATLDREAATIAFDGGGNLLGAQAEELFAIDPISGVTDSLSEFPHASLGSLAYSSTNGRLYSVDTNRGVLMEIEPGTWTGRNVGGVGIDPPEGLARDVGAGVTYAVERDRLFELEESGSALFIGEIGLEGVTSLAHSGATGFLYGFAIDQGQTLFARIDPATGQGTQIGGASGVEIQALACGPTGMAWAVDSTALRLHTVDVSTGARTEVGPLGIAGVPTGLTFDAATDALILGTEGGDLYRVDRSTGSAARIGGVGVPLSALGPAR